MSKCWYLSYSYNYMNKARVYFLRVQYWKYNRTISVDSDIKRLFLCQTNKQSQHSVIQTGPRFTEKAKCIYVREIDREGYE